MELEEQAGKHQVWASLPSPEGRRCGRNAVGLGQNESGYKIVEMIK